MAEGVLSIGGEGYGAFEGCTGLTSVTIPGTVTNMADLVFENCSSLTNLTIDDGYASIGICLTQPGGVPFLPIC
jgi:hypothetical protein